MQAMMQATTKDTMDMGREVYSGSGPHAQPGAWWPGEWGPAPGTPGAPRHVREPVVRRLAERDRPALEAFLDADPGYALFLRGNLLAYRLDGAFLRYWGAFDGDRLRAAAMLVAHRATLYAPPGTDVRTLARTLAHHGVDFTMSRPDLVNALLAALPDPVRRREEHYLAVLPGSQPPPVRVPAGAVVRRATIDDLDALTDLYTGSSGFERLSTAQVRRTINSRVRSGRTYLVLADGVPVAAASTTAETERAAMIGGVWTAPAARDRGYGTAVVAALCRELIEDGRAPYLFYLIDNAPAARIYARNGFRTVGHWSVAYLEQDDPE